MKHLSLLLTIFLCSYITATANNRTPGDGKKDEMNGLILHAETKKPLKDVNVTAYLSTRKEKIVISNETGGFSFDELKPGTYKFVFEKTGFKKITKDKVVIKTDETVQLTIEMLENNDFEIMPSPFSLKII